MLSKTLTISLLVIILILTGCGRIEEEPIVDEHNNGTDQIVEEDEEEIDEIMKIVNDMTVEEKIGQLFIFGLEGTEADESDLRAVEENHIGGFVLLKDNIDDADQTVRLLNTLKSRNSSNRLPLFLAVDEEGGLVSRLSDIYLDLPLASTIGEIDDGEVSLEYGQILGQRVRELGFNLNFAPVLDINSNPKNPIIGKRAYGTDVNTVVNNGLRVMEGINSTNVISVGKHFPGHGDTSVDSHIGLPVIDKSLEEMKSLELVPFEKAIEEGIDAIMVAHILFTQLDGENPATLSYNIITELLRERMSFDGVVISDDMTMGAIIENYTIEDAAYKFLKAGGDILLVCHGQDNRLKALNRIKDEVEKGNISEKELDEKVYRIVRLKMKYGLRDGIVEKYDVKSINNRIEQMLNRINHGRW
ncbi:MAG: beta-N-acetylhexosaminidase [Tissierellia bacterium]|nr:beta-N-acetylhexosaminidase [Tissierellia bacterium]